MADELSVEDILARFNGKWEPRSLADIPKDAVRGDLLHAQGATVVNPRCQILDLCVLIELPRRQHSPQKQRGVHGGQFALSPALPCAHVHEVIVKTA